MPATELKSVYECNIKVCKENGMICIIYAAGLKKHNEQACGRQVVNSRLIVCDKSFFLR